MLRSILNLNNEKIKQSFQSGCIPLSCLVSEALSVDIELMNLLLGCSKYFKFNLGKHEASVLFSYDEIGYDQEYLKIVFALDKVKHSILISILSFRKLLNTIYSDFNLVLISREMEYHLAQVLCYELIAIIQKYVALDLEIIAINYQNSKDPGGSIGIKLMLETVDHTNLGQCIQVALNLNSESIPRIKSILEHQLLKYKGSFRPNIPITAQLVIGVAYLDIDRLNPAHPNALKVNDVLVLKGSKSNVEHVFLLMFNKFFYRVKLIDDTKGIISN